MVCCEGDYCGYRGRLTLVESQNILASSLHPNIMYCLLCKKVLSLSQKSFKPWVSAARRKANFLPVCKTVGVSEGLKRCFVSV